MTRVESAISWMKDLAADNTHGYSQSDRWGPDYDCSSAVIAAWDQAGVPVKVNGATFTGNMRAAFLLAGFKDVTRSVSLSSGTGLLPGDILLNYTCHTAMYIGGNQLAHARSAEGHPESGDQTGNEIRIQSYFNFPWDCALRYEEEEALDNVVPCGPVASDKTGLIVDGDCGPETWTALIGRMPIVREGSISWAVTALQAMLNMLGADLDADGEFGPLTAQEVREFQEGLL